MAFRKKNRGAEVGGSTAVETETGGGVAVATKKKRKPQELLTSVIKESTVGAAVALMRDNERFALPNGTSWVVLGVRAEAIGGLSMKHKNDEAKGSIIELITADEIHTVATMEMLEVDTFGIIPSEKTLGRMDEFSLLKNAPYIWVVMTQTPENTLSAEPVADATYADACDVSRGSTPISEILPEVWSWGEGAADGAPDMTFLSTGGGSVDEPLIGGAAGFDDAADNPFLGAGTSDDAEPAIDYNELSDGDAPAFGSEFEQEFEQEFDSTPEPVVTVSPVVIPEALPGVDRVVDRVVDETEVRASIARRFLSTDLNLEIELDTFEINFNTNSPVIVFPLEEGDTDWLGTQINQLARQANTEMEQLHSNNKDALRELWVSLMSQHAEQVIVDVSPDREGSYYHRLMTAAKDDLADRRKDGPMEVAALRRELNERYEGEAATRGRQAAEQAVLRYKEQNRARHERELAEVGLASERASEEFFDGTQQVILNTRRKDAMARMDLGRTKILELLVERQQEQRDAEEALLKSWSAEMTRVLDDHRKDDIARSEALAEQLSRSTEIDALNAAHAERVQELRSEQAERIALLNKEGQKIRDEAVAELDRREQEWRHQISLEQVNTTSATNRANDLISQFAQFTTTVNGQHSLQVASLESDKSARSREARAATKMMTILIILIGVAALAVGFIVGSAVTGAPVDPSAAAAGVASWLGAGALPPTL